MISFQVSTQNNPLLEYNVKAAFLYNFTHFVEWPANALENNEPFIIGILGTDPFKSDIESTVSGENVKGHPILVQRYSDVKDIHKCHILFISNSEAGKVKEILSALPDKKILTVSDIQDFARRGGMIRFMKLNNKIKLQINPAAAKAAELNISSKLLRLADIVGL
jgi:hypothetical protein